MEVKEAILTNAVRRDMFESCFGNSKRFGETFSKWREEGGGDEFFFILLLLMFVSV